MSSIYKKELFLVKESTTLMLDQWFSSFFYIPPLQTQSLSIPPQQRLQMIIAKISPYLYCEETTEDYEPDRLFYNISHCS